MRNAEYDFFDVTRGIAAFWVYLSHLLLICGFWHPLLSRGDLAVDVFVMLSGFVIGLMRLNKPESYPRYILRRFARIYPAYLIALCLGIATSYLYGPVLGNSDYTKHMPWFASRHGEVFANFWQNLALHLSLLHGMVPYSIIPSSEYAFSGPLWSISLEWQFYLVAPLLFFLLAKKKTLTFLSFIVAVIIFGQIAIWIKGLWASSSPSFLPLRLDYFVIGMASAVAFKPSAYIHWPLKLSLIILIILSQSYLRGYSIALPIWGFTWFLASTAQNSNILRMSTAILRPIKWFGDRSYGFYIYHMPLLLVISYFVILGRFDIFGHWGALAILFVVSFPITTLAAAASYKYIETPIIERAKIFVNGTKNLKQIRLYPLGYKRDL